MSSVAYTLGVHRHDLAADQLETLVLVEQAESRRLLDLGDAPAPTRQAFGGLGRRGQSGRSERLVHANEESIDSMPGKRFSKGDRVGRHLNTGGACDVALSGSGH